MDKYQIRYIRPEELPELKPVIEKLSERLVESPKEDELQKSAKDKLLYGAFDANGKLIAYLHASRNPDFIGGEYLAVNPDYEKRGIGTKLVKRLFKKAADETTGIVFTFDPLNPKLAEFYFNDVGIAGVACYDPERYGVGRAVVAPPPRFCRPPQQALLEDRVKNDDDNFSAPIEALNREDLALFLKGRYAITDFHDGKYHFKETKAIGKEGAEAHKKFEEATDALLAACEIGDKKLISVCKKSYFLAKGKLDYLDSLSHEPLKVSLNDESKLKEAMLGGFVRAGNAYFSNLEDDTAPSA